MSRRQDGSGRLFTRQDIYDIRRVWDEKVEEGWFFADIARMLEPQYRPASIQSIIKVGKRETWREIGTGGGERSLVSNRLVGEHRRTGDRVPMPETYRMDSEPSELELARTAERLIIPPIRLTADGQIHLVTPGEEGMDALAKRGKV